MLVHVICALLESRPVRRAVVSIEDPSLVQTIPEMRDLLDSGAVQIVRAAASPSASVRALLDEVPGAVPLIVTTADHPLLTPAMIEYFWDSIPLDVDVAAAVVGEDVLLHACPGSVRTYIRFRDCAVTGANLFAFVTGRSARAVSFWAKVERHRKSPIQMVRVLGLKATLRFLLRRMPLSEALARFSLETGIAAAAVTMPFAEAGIDVDKPSDLALAEAIRARRARSVALPGTVR
jgi:hypothetical protein